MKKLINITDYHDDLNRYRDAGDLLEMTERFGLDGLEVMPSGEKPVYPFLSGQVFGVHMRCQSDWLDLWREDKDALNREYGNPGTWASAFGVNPRRFLLERARQDLDYARKCGAQYVVFHAGNVRISDILTNCFEYSDREVLLAAADFINTLLQDQENSFYFLVENLWWPGLRLTDASLTREFLDWIQYPKKGIMLDFGHFLHTNDTVSTQRESVSYLQDMLDQHEDLLDFVKGVHLHQSLGEAHAQRKLCRRASVPTDFDERFRLAMQRVLEIDRHEPFKDPGVRSLIRRLSPDFLTLEFLSENRTEHEAKIREQLFWLDA